MRPGLRVIRSSTDWYPAAKGVFGLWTWSQLNLLSKVVLNWKNMTEYVDLSEDAINFLVNNLTPKIEKLNLSWIARFWNGPRVNDKQMKALVDRCKKSPRLICGIVQFLQIQLHTSYIRNIQSFEELDVTRCKELSFR